MTKVPKVTKRLYVDIEVNGGSSSLLEKAKSKYCQLVSTYSYKGTIIPECMYEISAAVIVVISGKLIIIYPDGREDIVNEGGATFIPAGMKHVVKYLADTRSWLVLCPPDKDLSKLINGDK